MSQWDKFRQACQELEAWLRARIEAHAILFECVTEAPQTFEALKASGPVVPVPKYAGRPDTIYSDGGCNKCLYQAYHDYHHKMGAWDFGYPGEYDIAIDHQREAAETWLSSDGRLLLWVESWVRVDYHQRWGRFPRNEGLFHWIAFTQGVHAALAAEGI